MPPGNRYTWPDGTIHSTPYTGQTPNYAIPSGTMSPRVPTRDVYDSGIAAAQAGTRLGPNGEGFNPVFSSVYGTVFSNAQLETIIRTKYPYMAAFLNDPEIGPILRQAAANGWGDQELYGALQGTKWWRSTSSNARQWEQMVAEDPATAAATAAQTAANLQNRARSLGINMTDAQIRDLAVTATKNGWTDNQIVDNLLHSLNWSTLAGGDLTAQRDNVKRIAGQYLVNVSNATAQSYAAAIASGEMTEAGVASVMQRQAVARYGWMADVINQGVTPSQYLMPIRDTIANELELAPDAVDMMDPKWLGMIETRDPNTGEMRAATQNEALLAARRDPAWLNTGRASDMLTKAYSAISDVFGRRAI